MSTLATRYIFRSGPPACFIYIVAGFFCAYTVDLSGSVPPCKPIMGLLSHFCGCNATGKAGPFSYSSQHKKTMYMRYISTEAGTPSAEQIIKELRSSDDPQAIAKTMETLFHEWIVCDGSYPQSERATILYHYQAVQQLLSKVAEMDQKGGGSV